MFLLDWSRVLFISSQIEMWCLPSHFKQVKLWVQFLKTCPSRRHKKHLPFFLIILFLVSNFVKVLQCCGSCFCWLKKQLHFVSPCAVYKHVLDAILNYKSSLPKVLVKRNFSRTANSFLKKSKINLIPRRSWPNCQVILSLRCAGNFYVTAGNNIGP